MDKKMTKAEIKRRRETMLKARRDRDSYAVIIAERAAHGTWINPDELARYRDFSTTEIAATLSYVTATDLYWDRLRSDWDNSDAAAALESRSEQRNELRSGAGR